MLLNSGAKVCLFFGKNKFFGNYFQSYSGIIDFTRIFAQNFKTRKY
jgi:hypothetical protein